MKKNLSKIFLILALASTSTLQSCGTGVDPLVLFDEALPELQPIISSGSVSGSWLSQGYSATNPYWIFTGTFFSGNFLSPAQGVVTALDTNSITIMHSGRLATRIVGLQSINVRVGDTIAAGQALAFFLGGATLELHVFLDGRAVCPLSFLSQTFRTGMLSFGLPVCI